MLGDRFNADGSNCPRCFARKALTPVTSTDHAAPRRLDCTACWGRFRVEPATDAQVETLVQIPFEVHVARCQSCGVHVAASLRTCNPCNAAAFRA